MNIPVEIYPSVTADGLCSSAFIGRVPSVDVIVDRDEAMRRLRPHHENAAQQLGFGYMPFISAEQVHGAEIGVIESHSAPFIKGADALITDLPHVCLGIYVADCCAVYAVDVENQCIGLAHSGRKGTELGIVPKMIAKMTETYGTDPENVIVQLSPCIRPPYYEVDIASQIVKQCKNHGVAEVIDSGFCTASELDRYYSYRMEKGKTGRMLALFALSGKQARAL